MLHCPPTMLGNAGKVLAMLAHNNSTQHCYSELYRILSHMTQYSAPYTRVAGVGGLSETTKYSFRPFQERVLANQRDKNVVLYSWVKQAVFLLCFGHKPPCQSVIQQKPGWQIHSSVTKLYNCTVHCDAICSRTLWGVTVLQLLQCYSVTEW